MYREVCARERYFLARSFDGKKVFCVLVLGIETSCDETAAAIVDGGGYVLAQALYSQIKAHEAYGGVVPEIASREHLRLLSLLVQQCLKDAGVTLDALDGIAVTAGPGLIGGVIVGLMQAKGLAAVVGKPLIAVNHLEAHALTVRMLPLEELLGKRDEGKTAGDGKRGQESEPFELSANERRHFSGCSEADKPGEVRERVSFPYLMLLLSGGHCQFLVVEGVGRYHLLGQTIDDALGEAFDKVAKMMGLPYPGGPQVEAMARQGDEQRFSLPKPLCGKPGGDVSFSGLKTAVLRQLELLKKEQGVITDQDRADMCACFQATAAAILQNRLEYLYARCREEWPEIQHVVLAGGVAANVGIRQRLEGQAQAVGYRLVAPPMALCTDNAAMIAWAGVERLRLGLVDGLEVAPKARWPLADAQR